MKAVIFDLNGTMIDDMLVHHRAWQQKLRELGLEMDLEEVRQKVHGINEEILARLFGDRFTPEERKQISAEKEATYRQIFKPDLKLVDGLLYFLDMLQNVQVPMAIGSAAPPENVDFVLDNLNIRAYFQAVMHARDVSNGKPDPEIYLALADKLGVFPSNCIVFEDSPVGAKAAENAGMPMIIVTTTHQEEEFDHIHQVKLFIRDFTNLKLGDL